MSFPKTVQRFRAYCEDGSAIYSGELSERTGLPFYADGHPAVYRLEVATYVLTEAVEVPVDRSPERLATWKERNGRW